MESWEVVAALPGAQSPGKRIIVVEDEPLLAMDLEAQLADAGWDVVGVAGTLEQARQLVANAACDAALLDVNLAGRPVDELAAVLRRRNIPFAFATGYGRSGLPADFREAPVLNKPFSSDQLSAIADALVARDARAIPLPQCTTV